MYQRYQDQGLVLIGVHTTKRGEKMNDFVAKEGIDYPVAVDVDSKTTTAFKVDSYPDYYLIDRAGNLRVADLANGDLERAVQVLLAEKADGGKQTPAVDAEKVLEKALNQASAEKKRVLVHLGAPW